MVCFSHVFLHCEITKKNIERDVEMQNSLYVEISVVGICLLLIVLFSQRHHVGFSILQRYFNRLVFATILILVVDSASWLIDSAIFPSARAFNSAINTLYYCFNILVPYLWVVYMEFSLSKELKTTRRRLKLLGIPLALLFVLLIINLQAGIVFTIDENNVYHRSPGFLVYALLAYFYLGYATVRALAAARQASWNEDQKRYHTMALFGVLPAIGGLIQIFFYGVALIWIFVAVSIVLMYIDSLNRQISIDPLTGINNRRELTKYLMHETKDTARKGVLSLIMMDVDDFKNVNDTHGHYYGDNVLQAVAEILKQSCQHTLAFLSRFGGDEFCIVHSVDDIQAVDDMIAGIHSNITQWNQNHNEPVSIGLSIGYSVWQPDIDDTVDALYQRADQKMYEAKNNKKSKAS